MRLLISFTLVFVSLATVSLVTVRADEPLGYPPPDQVRTAFLKLLDRPKVPADAKLVDTKPHAPGWVIDHLSIASEKRGEGAVERVPMLVVRPEKNAKKLPAVIVLHG